jgi:tetratricopeptide (TPR) repeat protein
MQQGLKELAEEEKAKAMSIQMQQLVNQMKEEDEEEEAQIEIKQRLHMFEQVLALDPDDMLANNGAGECYVQLGQWQEALPHLEKAIKAKPSYTQVYLNMSSALSGLKEYEQALVMLEVGMRVAAKNGDMMPLKQMQGLKAKIESKLQ